MTSLRRSVLIWASLLIAVIATASVIATWHVAIVEGNGANCVPAALSLPPSHGKRRLAFSFSSGADVVTLPPLLLPNAVRAASEWQPVIAGLLDLGAAVGVTPRIFGARFGSI